MLPPPIRPYARMTKAQQRELCRYAATNSHLKLQYLSVWATRTFHLHSWVSLKTIGRVLKEADFLLSLSDEEARCKSLRNERLRKFEATLRDWVLGMEAMGCIVDGRAIKTEALRLHTTTNAAIANESHKLPPCKFSNGWLTKFQRRHKLALRQFHGEALSVDLAQVEKEREKLRQILGSYAPRNIYNFDETGFLYNWVPSRSICRYRRKGVKQPKDRITVALCVNMEGSDKRPPLYIGKAEKPHAFGKKKASDFGLLYRNTANAWMSTQLFCDWVFAFDADMRKTNRHVLLLVDNAPVHDRIVGELLTNVRLHFLPPTMTSHIQPLDQGTIANVKHYVKQALTVRHNKSIQETSQRPRKMNVLEAMLLFEEAWKLVKSSTVISSWRSAGIGEYLDEFGGQLGYLLQDLNPTENEPFGSRVDIETIEAFDGCEDWVGGLLEHVK